MHDVLVCGAGPAGSVAAVVLARAGARVRLIDRARFPREKLCGDTVNPGAMAILERLGLAQAASSGLLVDGMIVTDESGIRCVSRYGNGIHGRALGRASLDARLLEAAASAGADIEQGVLVQGPFVDAGKVQGLVLRGSNGASYRVTAPMVIAADGASSRVARALSLARQAPHPRRWAVGAYFDNVPASTTDGRFGEMHLRRGRYVGVAPMPGGVTNACIVTADRQALRDPATLLCETLRRDTLLADRFARARIANRPVCLGPLAVDSVACGVPGLLLAGDAAGFVDPMTGDGLRFAFRGAELAALTALSALEHGTRTAHAALWRARRREFAFKWRYNRTLRALVGSPRAMQVAAAGARWAPQLLEQVIHYAGDVKRR
jgi:flavin-dependent dehydrogenase